MVRGAPEKDATHRASLNLLALERLSRIRVDRRMPRAEIGRECDCCDEQNQKNDLHGVPLPDRDTEPLDLLARNG
jgi:hypothetical protein